MIEEDENKRGNPMQLSETTSESRKVLLKVSCDFVVFMPKI